MSDEKEAALLSTTSFGTIGLSVGLPLLLYGFCAYFSFLPGADISALMLIYGFPISLIGFALKYAELEPLTCVTYEDALRENARAISRHQGEIYALTVEIERRAEAKAEVGDANAREGRWV